MNKYLLSSSIVAAALTLLNTKAAELPSPVASEIARFERERAAALRPLLAEHQKRLSQIMADLTKGGRVREALMAAEALKAIQADEYAPQPPFAGTRWTRASSSEDDSAAVRLDSGGVAKSIDGGWESRGLVTHWKYYGNGVLLLTIEKGRSSQLCEVWLLDKQLSSYKGYSFEGTPIQGRLLSAKE